MEHPKPKYEQLELPRLTDETKKMNGKSSQKLSQSIDKLSELLDEDDKQDETLDEFDPLRDLGAG